MPAVRDHFCAIQAPTSWSYLPPLRPGANCFQRFLRKLKMCTLISEKNPRCKVFLRSYNEIFSMRKEHVKANTCIIHPLSIFRVYYEMYMAIVFLMCFIFLPLDAAFVHEAEITAYFIIIDNVLCFLCLIDIVIRFLTGHANEKERSVIIEPAKIAKSHFVVDLLSSLPELSHLIKNEMALRILDTLSIMKIIRIFTTFNYVSRSGEFLKINNGYFTAFKYFIFVFIMFHWLACFSFLLPQFRLLLYGNVDNESWVFQWDNLFYKDFTTKYIISIYRISGYIFSVEFQPQRVILWEEMLFGCFLYCSGRLFMLFFTVMVAQMFQKVQVLEMKFVEVMEQLEAFMNRKGLPMHLRKRLVQNYRYKYHNTFFKENKIRGLLSEQLKREINVEMLQRLVNAVDLFTDLPAKTLEGLLTHLQMEIYLPGDIIVKAGANGDCMYFLASGTVSVSTPAGKEICHLQDGAYFGEVCLAFKEKKRTASVVALEICEIYKLSKKGFNLYIRTRRDLMAKLSQVASERMEITSVFEDIHLTGLTNNMQQRNADY